MRHFFTTKITLLALASSAFAITGDYTIQSNDAECRNECYCFPNVPNAVPVVLVACSGENGRTDDFCASHQTVCVETPPSPMRRVRRWQRVADAAGDDFNLEFDHETKRLERRTPVKDKNKTGSSTTGTTGSKKAMAQGSTSSKSIKPKPVKATYALISNIIAKVPGFKAKVNKIPAWLKKILDAKGSADQK